MRRLIPTPAPPDRQIKTLVYVLDGEPVLVLLRGDHELQEQKLLDVTGAVDIRPAEPEEIRPLLGADPGSLGAVGVKGPTVIADNALWPGARAWSQGRTRTIGTIQVSTWVVTSALGCGPSCGPSTPANRARFAATRWSVGRGSRSGTSSSWEPSSPRHSGPTCRTRTGVSHPIIMGSYGIGVERAMAAVVESSYDDGGIIWPVSVAPYEVVITVVRPDDGPTMEAANGSTRSCTSPGIEVLIDDRDERPGVKFADSELIGIPYRVTVGPRGVAEGSVELTARRGMVKSDVALADSGAAP